jgi:hypothetical protein
MAKDAKGHGSEKRGGDYAKDASGKPGYNPVMQGGQRMFGRQPTAAEKAANSANVKAFSNFAAAQNAPQGVGPRQAAMARLEASGKIPAGTLQTVAGLLGTGAHTEGVQKVGNPPPFNREAVLRKYNSNEDNNFHSENVSLLAKHFGTPAEQSMAKEIEQERNRIGQLPDKTASVPNVRDFQYSINKNYFPKLIGNKFGGVK